MHNSNFIMTLYTIIPQELNSVLSDRIFLLSSSAITLADIILYYGLHRHLVSGFIFNFRICYFADLIVIYNVGPILK